MTPRNLAIIATFALWIMGAGIGAAMHMKYRDKLIDLYYIAVMVEAGLLLLVPALLGILDG